MGKDNYSPGDDACTFEVLSEGNYLKSFIVREIVKVKVELVQGTACAIHAPYVALP